MYQPKTKEEADHVARALDEIERLEAIMGAELVRLNQLRASLLDGKYTEAAGSRLRVPPELGRIKRNASEQWLDAEVHALVDERYEEPSRVQG